MVRGLRLDHPALGSVHVDEVGSRLAQTFLKSTVGSNAML